MLNNRTKPTERFHYKLHAADLVWQASLLMPDDHEALDEILCIAGSWIRYKQPQEADRFFKALVRRCRNTDLGTETNALKWFPKRIDYLDEPLTL